MLRLGGWAALVLCAFGGVRASAQTFLPANGTAHSAFRDTSNIGGAELNYRVNLQTLDDGVDRYLNSVVLNKDSNWDPNLTLDAAGSSFFYNDINDRYTEKTYTLGTIIAPNSNWDCSAATRLGSVDSSVADGIYNATLEFFGGESDTATDLLASFDITLEVFQKLDISVGMTASPDTLFAGEASQFTMTVTNNMTGKDFVSTTWYVSGIFDGNNELIFRDFDGDWFNKTIAPGDNRTDLHSTWVAGDTQVNGVYTGNQGVVGGLYNGDFYFVSSDVPTSVTVVPGPDALFVAGMCLLTGVSCLRRRKAAK